MAPTSAVSSDELFAGFDESPASYLRLARELGARDHGLTRRTVGLVATFTIDVLAPYFVVEAARRRLAVTPAIAPFGQLEQQLLDPASALHQARPDVIVIATRLEDVAPVLVHDFVRMRPADVAREIDAVGARIEGLVRGVRQHTGAHLVVWNHAPPALLAAGLADPATEPSQIEAVVQVNRRIAAACRAVPGAYVLDACRLATEVGLAAWHDAKLFHWARVPFAPAAQLAAARRLARVVRALDRPPCKCLVVDLDNTLWGGVLGEDGLGGIALGDEYPGNVFKAFQRQLRALRDRGVLLAIASKNNEADVVELFATHRDLVLSRDDFAATQIHWNDKAASLRAIALQLNIGVDSLAFFDDNPVERAWVAEQLPEVTVIDVPADPLRYGAALEASGAFDALVLTDEDRGRAEMYRGEVARDALAATTGSVDDFLRALRMKIEIGPFDPATLPRIAQLLGKTNQFNLTTRRHGRADLERFVADGGVGLWMRIEDRFGDNGLIGVALAVPAPGGAFAIDTFLMSCRVLGRKAEDTLLWSLARRVRARGATRLDGEFIPTKKNAPAAQFLPGQGFVADPERPGWWTLDLTDAPPPSNLFEVIDHP